jgi:hypothetical protein
MVGATIEEKAILYAQHLDFIYYQLGTLYDIIPNSPLLSTDPHQPHPTPHANSVVTFPTIHRLSNATTQNIHTHTHTHTYI